MMSVVSTAKPDQMNITLVSKSGPKSSSHPFDTGLVFARSGSANQRESTRRLVVERLLRSHPTDSSGLYAAKEPNGLQLSTNGRLASDFGRFSIQDETANHEHPRLTAVP